MRDGTITPLNQVITEDTETMDPDAFKHPRIGICTESGRCGFVLREREKEMAGGEPNFVQRETTTRTLRYISMITSPSMKYCGIEHCQVKQLPVRKVTVAGKWEWWRAWLPDIKTGRTQEYI